MHIYTTNVVKNVHVWHVKHENAKGYYCEAERVIRLAKRQNERKMRQTEEQQNESTEQERERERVREKRGKKETNKCAFTL